MEEVRKVFWLIKRAWLFLCRDGMFFGWEDFSPESIKKKYHVEYFWDMLGFSVVASSFHKVIDQVSIEG